MYSPTMRLPTCVFAAHLQLSHPLPPPTPFHAHANTCVAHSGGDVTIEEAAATLRRLARGGATFGSASASRRVSWPMDDSSWESRYVALFAYMCVSFIRMCAMAHG